MTTSRIGVQVDPTDCTIVIMTINPATELGEPMSETVAASTDWDDVLASIDEALEANGLTRLDNGVSDESAPDWTTFAVGLAVLDELHSAGQAWIVAREDERATAEHVKELMREAHGRGASEVEIARLAGVDRMTVRRALGKL
jgi:hypothetical protein